MYLLTGKLYCGECKSPMVGVSGTGQHGELHYYYTCKTHRANRSACRKKQVTRDYAEELIASKLKQLISRYEVIEWLADSVLAYLKEHQETDEIIMLEEKLSNLRKEKDNTLKAIRQGVIHPAVQEMLEQISTEESSLAAKLTIAQDRIRNDITRGHVIAWVETFKDGNVKDKNYQEQLFDAFLVRAYLYDDHIRIVFNYTGKGTEEVDVPFDVDKVEEYSVESIEITESGEMVPGSYKSDQPPYPSKP